MQPMPTKRPNSRLRMQQHNTIHGKTMLHPHDRPNSRRRNQHRLYRHEGSTSTASLRSQTNQTWNYVAAHLTQEQSLGNPMRPLTIFTPNYATSTERHPTRGNYDNKAMSSLNTTPLTALQYPVNVITIHYLTKGGTWEGLTQDELKKAGWRVIPPDLGRTRTSPSHVLFARHQTQTYIVSIPCQDCVRRHLSTLRDMRRTPTNVSKPNGTRMYKALHYDGTADTFDD